MHFNDAYCSTLESFIPIVKKKMNTQNICTHAQKMYICKFVETNKHDSKNQYRKNQLLCDIKEWLLHMKFCTLRGRQI